MSTASVAAVQRKLGPILSPKPTTTLPSPDMLHAWELGEFKGVNEPWAANELIVACDHDCKPDCITRAGALRPCGGGRRVGKSVGNFGAFNTRMKSCCATLRSSRGSLLHAGQTRIDTLDRGVGFVDVHLDDELELIVAGHASAPECQSARSYHSICNFASLRID